MSANRFIPPLQNHSTDIAKKASTHYGGMITFSYPERDHTIIAPLNKSGKYGHWLLPLTVFKIDNAPASTRIRMTPFGVEEPPYDIEIAVSGASTGWIKISDLSVKSSVPEADNIVAPGVIMTARGDYNSPAVDYVIIYPNN